MQFSTYIISPNMPFGFFALGIISVILLSTCAEGELRRGDWANDDVDKRSLVKRFDPDQVHYLGLDKRSSEEFSGKLFE